MDSRKVGGEGISKEERGRSNSPKHGGSGSGDRAAG